jgi:putative intracellular protease/amidase
MSAIVEEPADYEPVKVSLALLQEARTLCWLYAHLTPTRFSSRSMKAWTRWMQWVRWRSSLMLSTTQKTQVCSHGEVHVLDCLAGKTRADSPRSETKAFRTIFAGPAEHVVTAQGASIRAHLDYAEAMKRLSEIDVLVIPGGNHEAVIKAKGQPLQLIKAFTELQKKQPTRERTIMSVCTGSLFLGEAGILSGLTATTHPDFITKFEIICSNAAQRDMADRVDVVEERYVVNNLRFELGENEDENPHILNRKELKEQKRRKSSAGGISPISENSNGFPNGRRPSSARKGSMSLKMSNTRRESILKRANLRLGGMRVLTTSGIASGMDGALYMVGALVSDEVAEEVARKMCYTWKKGTVVDGVDV